MPPDLTILHQTARYVVIDKPAGLLSVPGKGEHNQDCAASRVRAAIPHATGPLVVHRLDMDTSGLLVFGLDADAQRDLSLQFQGREVEKRYIALVEGVMPAERGEIDLPIRPDIDNRPVQIVDPIHGRPSVTRWTLLAIETDRSRLELEPITGRTHQLRVHLAHIGHPILGDVLYGRADTADRLTLHAAMLRFRDPDTRQLVEFRSTPHF